MSPACNLATHTLHDETSCGDLWQSYRSGNPFGDWDLRCALAKNYQVSPHFIVDENSGAVLPSGLTTDGDIVFFGGTRFSEGNRMLRARNPAPLAYLASRTETFSLLCWDEDPLENAAVELSAYDVPFNQYWIVEGDADLSDHVASLDQPAVKELEYVQRKFSFEITPGVDWPATRAMLEHWFEETSGNFARRGRSFALDDARNRAAALIVCEHACKAGVLYAIEILYRGTPAGICVMIDDKAVGEAVYLLNLCGTSPSKVSNAVAFAPVVYGCRLKRRVDGLRGSFTLKKKYGYKPKPSYAFVRHPGWKISDQTDLTPGERLALYGREFGRLASPHST